MSQRRSDLHILLNFSIFPRYVYWNRIPVWYKFSDKKNFFLIDIHDKVTMSETFDKSQMSESFDVPAGCNSRVFHDKQICQIDLTDTKYNF